MQPVTWKSGTETRVRVLPSNGYTVLVRGSGPTTNMSSSPGFIFRPFSGAPTGLLVLMDPVIEYYNKTLDHYFMTTVDKEIGDLDSGVHTGWMRTGQTFKAYGIRSSGPMGRRPVCRAYGKPEARLNSHFYSASHSECFATLANFNGEQFGVIDLTTALTHSVNTVWAQVAVALGKPRLAATMEKLGFDHDPPLDYPASQMRPSGEYKDGRLLSPLSRFVDVGRMGIGQDKLQVTPMQMAMVASAVANGGVLMQPHIASRILDRDGRTVRRIAPQVESHVMSASTARQVGQMMANVVREGTGTAAALQGVDVAGKTGTAEVGSCPTGSQLSFIGFAPVNRPRVAVAVTVECAPGQGGTVAAPIAKQVMEALLR